MRSRPSIMISSSIWSLLAIIPQCHSWFWLNLWANTHLIVRLSPVSCTMLRHPNLLILTLMQHQIEDILSSFVSYASDCWWTICEWSNGKLNSKTVRLPFFKSTMETRETECIVILHSICILLQCSGEWGHRFSLEGSGPERCWLTKVINRKREVQSAGRLAAAVVTVIRWAGRKEKVLQSHAEQRV